MSRSGLLAALALLGCGASPAPPRSAAGGGATPAAAAPPIAVTAASVGPITAKTPANLVALRAALRGYTVRAQNGGMFSELHFAVSGPPPRDEVLFYVIPTDEGGEIFNIHVMSPSLPIGERPWRVGKPVADLTPFTACDCWANMPVCYRGGEHLAVVFSYERDCDIGKLSTAEGRAVLAGVPVHRGVWNPHPFPGGDGDGSDGGDGDGSDGVEGGVDEGGE